MAAASSLAATRVPANPITPELAVPMTAEQLEFLQDLRRRCYHYFEVAADPTTGLVADRASRDGSRVSTVASSAACGFALAAHSLAPASGLATRAEALTRAQRLLRSLLQVAQHEHGFVYHFFDRRDGRRRFASEASSIDTAIMLGGVMAAQTTFDEPQVQSLCTELIERTQWRWMLGSNHLFHMGWKPESGFLPYQWDSFSEMLLLVLMALGAPNNAVPTDCWQAWRREPVLHYQGRPFMSYPPLFVHQYPLAFFDLQHRESSSGWNYWHNAQTAHEAHIEFLSALAAKYPETLGHYGEDLWGITSSDSEDGYRDWGGPYEDGRIEPDRGIDGTLVPSAAAGALPFVPQQALRTLQYQQRQFGDQIYGRFGFANAFNPATGWVSRDVIGIDTGIALLMTENLLSGSLWDAFMEHPIAERSLARAGFSNKRLA